MLAINTAHAADWRDASTSDASGLYDIGMIRIALFTVILAFAPPAWARTTDVTFVSGANRPAVRQAVQAIREATQMGNVPLSTISAALIDLNGDGSPELFVEVSGGFCGSLGCAIMLFEQGTGGWIKIGDWIAGYVSVTDTRDGGWLRLLLNHTRAWRHGTMGYDIVPQK